MRDIPSNSVAYNIQHFQKIFPDDLFPGDIYKWAILFKKYNKIFFKLRYENLVKWTVHNDKFILVWNIVYLDDLYKKNLMFQYHQFSSGGKKKNYVKEKKGGSLNLTRRKLKYVHENC